VHTNTALPSSLIMVTVRLLGSTTVARSGSEDGLIARVNSSLASRMLSSFIGTLNEILVCPVLNVTEYGPES